MAPYFWYSRVEVSSCGLNSRAGSSKPNRSGWCCWIRVSKASKKALDSRWSTRHSAISFGASSKVFWGSKTEDCWVDRRTAKIEGRKEIEAQEVSIKQKEEVVWEQEPHLCLRGESSKGRVRERAFLILQKVRCPQIRPKYGGRFYQDLPGSRNQRSERWCKDWLRQRGVSRDGHRYAWWRHTQDRGS